MSPAKKKPSAIGDVLAGVLKDAGLAARVEQAGIIPEWSALVGAQISAPVDGGIGLWKDRDAPIAGATATVASKCSTRATSNTSAEAPFAATPPPNHRAP